MGLLQILILAFFRPQSQFFCVSDAFGKLIEYISGCYQTVPTWHIWFILFYRRLGNRKGFLKRRSSSSSLVKSSSIEIPATEEELALISKDGRCCKCYLHGQAIRPFILFASFADLICRQLHDDHGPIGETGVAAVVAGDSGGQVLPLGRPSPSLHRPPRHLRTPSTRGKSSKSNQNPLIKALICLLHTDY